MRYRRGTLPPLQLTLPLGLHSLSNVDREAKTADCTICGPGIRIRVQERYRHGGLQCLRALRRTRRKLSHAENRKQNLKRKYQISVDDYERMYREQGGACRICEKPFPKLVVDHCHKSGEVRGLLCRDCNLALGFLRDMPDAARRAASYLER